MSGLDEIDPLEKFECGMCGHTLLVKDIKKFYCPHCVGPVSLGIDFCEACPDGGTHHCDGCIRGYLNELLDYNEDWRDNHRANRDE